MKFLKQNWWIILLLAMVAVVVYHMVKKGGAAAPGGNGGNGKVPPATPIIKTGLADKVATGGVKVADASAPVQNTLPAIFKPQVLQMN